MLALASVVSRILLWVNSVTLIRYKENLLLKYDTIIWYKQELEYNTKYYDLQRDPNYLKSKFEQ